MWAQEDGDDGESDELKYMMVELNYIRPKIGSEKVFIEAVKKHNAKYHTEAPYTGFLWYIRTGENAGWFVWGMGPLIFSDLDDAPGEGAHMEDWAKSVAPHVAQYGHVENWVYKDAWSYSDGKSNAKQIVWIMDIQDGKRDQFDAFMKSVTCIRQKKKNSRAGRVHLPARDEKLRW